MADCTAAYKKLLCTRYRVTKKNINDCDVFSDICFVENVVSFSPVTCLILILWQKENYISLLKRKFNLERTTFEQYLFLFLFPSLQQQYTDIKTTYKSLIDSRLIYQKQSAIPSLNILLNCLCYLIYGIPFAIKQNFSLMGFKH